MVFSGSIDSRLVPACLFEAGFSAASSNDIRSLLAEQLSGRHVSPGSHEAHLNSRRADVTLTVQWDSVLVEVQTDDATAGKTVAKAFEKFGNTYDVEIQSLLKGVTGLAVRDLDACLKAAHVSMDGLRNGSHAFTLDVAQTLITFHTASIDRVIHEEIVGLMALPIADKAARALLGSFLIEQFPLPAKRTHRFVICQALANVAEPELEPGLAKLASETQFASLRGRLCEALAKTRHPDAASHIAAVLKNGDDETKLCAIEALGELKATHFTDAVRDYLTYQSSDKEWTSAIKKAAEKALKRM